MRLAFEICRGRSLGHLDPGPETRESNLTLNRAAGRGWASRSGGAGAGPGGGGGRGEAGGGAGGRAGWRSSKPQWFEHAARYEDAEFLSRAILRTWGENRK